jgi:monoamine oxidase
LIEAMSDPVLIIGAGVAGLSAAAALREKRVDVILLEASGRIGGRAWTTRIGGHPFDHGAAWLHHAERNPLVAFAEPDDLIDSDALRKRRVMVGDRMASETELAARKAAYELFETTVDAAQGDPPIARALDKVRRNPWIPSIEAIEAAMIAAADPADFSVQDYIATALDGSNRMLRGGLGAFVARVLGPPAGPLFLDTPVHAIDWRDGIRAETARGAIRASACILTCSTAALGHMRFTPALPVSPEGLPMGLLTKIVFRARGGERLGLAPYESVSPMIADGEPYLSFHPWPGGADHAIAFVGGPQAWALSREGDAAAFAFARARLRQWFGADADKFLEDVLVTDWGRNPWQLGAYAYARPGHAGDRAALGLPFADGCMVIAGEATAQDGLAGTVGGAWIEGRRAAACVLDAIGIAG